MYKDGYSTLSEHMPERHKAYAESKEYNAAYFQKRASQVGPEARAVIDATLSRPYFVQQSYRACQGILRLSSRYGNEKLENAGRHIEPKSAASYKMVESILRTRLEDTTSEGTDNQTYMPHDDEVRGSSEYQ